MATAMRKIILAVRKIFRLALFSRRRRRVAVGAALWLLRLAFEAETADMWRCSDRLDELDSSAAWDARRKYAAAEAEYSDRGCVLGFLECAIEDLQFSYSLNPPF